ncbi:hypothetical protein X777_16711 [Ooceraea biroi]|uniref:Uncharacterized protein n=1 Tax=Ooceraea biroi TaxID=2015173 RepID=A0A026VW52_OOCBI|nr:hypothetical protein X777_16711 [Ooceraea biroi]
MKRTQGEEERKGESLVVGAAGREIDANRAAPDNEEEKGNKERKKRERKIPVKHARVTEGNTGGTTRRGQGETRRVARVYRELWLSPVSIARLLRRSSHVSTEKKKLLQRGRDARRRRLPLGLYRRYIEGRLSRMPATFFQSLHSVGGFARVRLPPRGCNPPAPLCLPLSGTHVSFAYFRHDLSFHGSSRRDESRKCVLRSYLFRRPNTSRIRPCNGLPNYRFLTNKLLASRNNISLIAV